MFFTAQIRRLFARQGAFMNSSLLSLLVLAGIAIFLILRLRSVLGTREGFENPPVSTPTARPDRRRDFEVIEGGPDRDITDHVEDGSDSAKALAAMKLAEPGFSVSEFLQGARGAYEMILMAFENGDVDGLRPFLAPDVMDTFETVIRQRQEQNLTIDASFIGIRELALDHARFDRATGMGEITVRFVGELTSVVRNADRQVVEGDPNEIKRQRDVWTFARTMGANDPNWELVATD
jgi:predicted lipid-binding transport protein (Tim44 family)